MVLTQTGFLWLPVASIPPNCDQGVRACVCVSFSLIFCALEKQLKCLFALILEIIAFRLCGLRGEMGSRKKKCAQSGF